MKTFVSGQVIAACFALASFAVAIIAGLASNNSAAQILLRALIAMAVCYPVGMAAGLICHRVIAAHLEAHSRKNPEPDSEAAPHDASANAAAEEEPLVV